MVPAKRFWVCSACGQTDDGANAGMSAGPSSSAGPHPCRNLWCAAPGRPLEAVFAVGNYEGAFRKAIVAYKYGWDLRWARTFGGLLHTFVAHHATWFEEYAVICPVPSYMGPEARRPRGHVGLICSEMSRLAGGSWPVESLVAKVSETQPMNAQAGPARRELARRSLRDAFSVTGPGAVAGSRILLVDDVCATGWTLLTVARALRRSGAEEVAALVLARARWRPRRRAVPGGSSAVMS